MIMERFDSGKGNETVFLRTVVMSLFTKVISGCAIIAASCVIKLQAEAQSASASPLLFNEGPGLALECAENLGTE